MGIRSPDFLEMSESMGVTFGLFANPACLHRIDANFAGIVVFCLIRKVPGEHSRETPSVALCSVVTERARTFRPAFKMINPRGDFLIDARQ
jgi:hypothetical protein